MAEVIEFIYADKGNSTYIATKNTIWQSGDDCQGRYVREADFIAATRCDACCGEGKSLTGLPCICGGSGDLADAVVKLREKLFDTEAQRDELLEALKRSLSQHKGCDCGVCDQMEAAIRRVEEGR